MNRVHKLRGAVPVFLLAPLAAAAEVPGEDTGPGIPISRRGTYVQEGEWLLIPSLGYSDDEDFEYNSGELGFTPAVDELKGHYRASEAALLFAYGVSERLVVEFGAEGLQARLQTAENDPSNAPAEVQQSGLGDVKIRADWRWLTESGRRPEVVPYAQVRVPHDRNELLTGTPDWLMNAGFSTSRRFDWGTTTLRVGVEFDLASASVTDWGEVALEYQKHITPGVTVLGSLQMLEGDEGSFIAQVEWQASRNCAVQFSSGFALTSHAIDWAPEVSFVVRLR